MSWPDATRASGPLRPARPYAAGMDDADGSDRRGVLASTALAAVAGAAGASVLANATPAGAATSDVRVTGKYRVGSGFITPAAGRTLNDRYDPGTQVGALGVRIDDAPLAGVPGTTFSRTRPLEIRALHIFSTRVALDPATEVWLAPRASGRSRATARRCCGP